MLSQGLILPSKDSQLIYTASSGCDVAFAPQPEGIGTHSLHRGHRAATSETRAEKGYASLGTCTYALTLTSTLIVMCRVLQEVCGTLATHESAWLRFQEYASLVREIIVNPFLVPEGSYSIPLEDTFWYRLSSAFGDMPILPRLEVATIRSKRSLDVDAGVLRLLNPSTRELDVNLPNISWEQAEQLEKPFKDCVSLMQNLEILWMRADLGKSRLERFLDLESLPRLHPRLRNLTFCQDSTPSVELNRLRHLAALPDLENLTVNPPVSARQIISPQ